ncbi:MAG: cell division protein SepF [Lachnospiraceae bacterium]|nr:cell division protein SepF [Lachnospiraceae bacterium]
MGIFKNIIDSLKLSDDSDFDDYDDYDDYIAAEEEKARKKAEKKAERDAQPKFSLKETLFRKKAKEEPEAQPYGDDFGDDDMGMAMQAAPQPVQQNQRTPLYSNNTVSIQDRRSGYASGTMTFEERYKAREAAMYRQQQPARTPVARPAAQPVQQSFSQVPSIPPVITPANRTVRDALGVTIIKPQGFDDDCQEICDNLINGNPIIVNLEGFDKDKAQRLMDFVSGCVYSIGGNLNQISSYIFIISPANIDVTGDYNALMRQDGFGVPTFRR